jgi:hypothetical protein
MKVGKEFAHSAAQPYTPAAATPRGERMDLGNEQVSMLLSVLIGGIFDTAAAARGSGVQRGHQRGRQQSDPASTIALHLPRHPGRPPRRAQLADKRRVQPRRVLL